MEIPKSGISEKHSLWKIKISVNSSLHFPVFLIFLKQFNLLIEFFRGLKNLKQFFKWLIAAGNVLQINKDKRNIRCFMVSHNLNVKQFDAVKQQKKILVI